ncbi:flagellar hook-associated protein FlgL [Bacillus sp. 7586-K]|uniref:Flagellar hook-associated protein 3 FlgL n=1 Tax=Metabacillus niabensis TaxID=324854 RepID=A0ABT9Z4F9_9BACI|nr:flagellar hook-associated protein FlgL [Metabacillus niabensis]MDQ0227141.1 flagellar hook-associated protein 3 FlgL [Metabacillus niabensis]PAD69608.1 flagellar hook-associated protein FlgL [Bacillus sp. 7586-K]
MRVTQSMLASNSLRNLSKSYSNMGKYQDQLATGKKISRPSDDPVVAIKGMFYRTNLTEVEQYKRNLNEAYTWMENSEAGIEQATQVIQRIRELTVQANNSTNSPEDLKAIGVEISQLKEDLIGVANTKVAGNYIFNGTQTKNPPIPLDANGNPDFSQINSTAYNIEVSKGVQLKVNVDANNLFSQELFDTLSALETNLLDGEGTLENGDELLADLDKHIDSMLAERSELGARYNRLELVDSRLSDQEVIANRILSDNEDADIERVITDLTIQESIHRASLSVGARIIQPSLIDFLR